MKVFNATLTGITPYSQNKVITSPKTQGETHDAHEKRTWRERMHADHKGNLYIPGCAVKNMMADVAKYLSESVPGKGSSKYSKHFEAGLLVVENFAVLDAKGRPIPVASVEGEEVHVPSDGKRGSGSRVWKTFGAIKPGWTAQVSMLLVDPVLIDHPDVVERYLRGAGQFIGLGRWRARNGGQYGRFTVADVAVKEYEV